MSPKRMVIVAAIVVALLSAALAIVIRMDMPNRMVISREEVVSGKAILDGLRQVVRKEGYDILVQGQAMLDGKQYQSGQHLTWNGEGAVVEQTLYQRSKNALVNSAWRVHLLLKPAAVDSVRMKSDGLFEVTVTNNRPMRFK